MALAALERLNSRHYWEVNWVRDGLALAESIPAVTLSLLCFPINLNLRRYGTSSLFFPNGNKVQRISITTYPAFPTPLAKDKDSI